MTISRDAIETAALVKQARLVERLLARRRRQLKNLRDLDEELRTARRFLRDLAMPAEDPVNRGELGELLPDDGGER